MLLDVPTFRTTRVLEGHVGSVLSVAFSPDSRVLATGSADGTVRLWEVTTGRFLLASGAHQQAVTSVAFSPHTGAPNQIWLATASRDRLVRLWSLTVSA
jgi:WD40 repeat protein